MFGTILGLIKSIVSFFSGKQTVQSDRAQTFVNSRAIDFLLFYLISVMVYNDFAFNCHWHQFVTQLNPVQSLAAIGGFTTLRIGHHYFLNN